MDFFKIPRLQIHEPDIVLHSLKMFKFSLESLVVFLLIGSLHILFNVFINFLNFLMLLQIVSL